MATWIDVAFAAVLLGGVFGGIALLLWIDGKHKP